jgi:hypothetical protein
VPVDALAVGMERPRADLMIRRPSSVAGRRTRVDLEILLNNGRSYNALFAAVLAG